MKAYSYHGTFNCKTMCLKVQWNGNYLDLESHKAFSNKPFEGHANNPIAITMRCSGYIYIAPFLLLAQLACPDDLVLTIYIFLM